MKAWESIKNIFTRNSSEDRSITSEDAYRILGAGYSTQSGVHVNEQTALTFSAVFSCVNVLSRSVASLPLHVYIQNGRSREIASNSKAYKLLHDEPNPEMTSYSWRSALMTHLALWGNCYCEIEFDGRGGVKALWPIPPGRVKVNRLPDGRLYYELNLQDIRPGHNNEPNWKVLPPYRMLHVLGTTTSGVKGISPIGAARETIGMGLAAQEFGARFFEQGTHVGGIAKHPGKLSDQAYEHLKNDLREKHEGLGKAHRLMLLEEGMEYQSVGMPLKDAQFLESRKFQVIEIARMFNVPLHMIQEHEKSTTWGTGIEQLNLGFVMHTLRPYFCNFEQEFNRKLLKDKPGYYTKFKVEGLLRGDSESRANFYQTMLQNGIYSINDIRELEDMNPVEDGDTHFIASNLQTVDTAVAMAGMGRELQGQEDEQQEEQPEQEENQAQTGMEKRFRRPESAQKRSQIADSFAPIITEKAEKLVQREVKQIRKKADEHLNNRSRASFEDWLESFYNNFPETIKEEMKPALESLGLAIGREAAEEVDAEDVEDAIKEFVDEYNEAFAKRHSDSSKGQLKALIRDAREKAEDPYEKIEQRCKEWEETRAGKITMNERVQCARAVAKTVFAGAGVTQLRWVAVGAETCPLCEEMDGKVVGIDQPFLAENSKLDSEDRKPIRLNRPTTHPPLHQGCVCEISPA